MNPIIALIIVNIIWGAAPPIFKFALYEIPPFTLAFIRFLFAGIIFLPFCLHKCRFFSLGEWKNLFHATIWGISLNIAFFFLGLRLAPSINVHVISTIAPVLLYFLSLRMLKEKPNQQIISGILISLFGAMIIILAPLYFSPQDKNAIKEIATSYSTVIGNLFFVIAVIGSVFGTIYTKRGLKTIDPLLFTTATFLFSALTFLPLTIIEWQNWSFQDMQLNSWIGIIYGVFFSSAAAYYLNNYALAKITAQKAAIYVYIEPVISVLVAIPLLGEYPDLAFVVGSILVFAGIFYSQKHPHFNEVHQKFQSDP